MSACFQLVESRRLVASPSDKTRFFDFTGCLPRTQKTGAGREDGRCTEKTRSSTLQRSAWIENHRLTSHRAAHRRPVDRSGNRVGSK
jgi:hypothetical protein